jgi:hypothetical protein
MAPVTGEVRLRLFKGSVASVGRRSPHSLYDLNLSTFEGGYGYDQADAGGFIRLLGLPLEAELRRATPALAKPAARAAKPASPAKATRQRAAAPVGARTARDRRVRVPATGTDA